MSAYQVREFLPGDIGAALQMWRRTEGIGLSEADRPDALCAFLKRNPGLSRVACGDLGLVGTLLCGTDGRRGYIHHLAVADGARRSGIGRALLGAALESLRRAGIRKCHAFVYRSNPFAELFWGREGWQRRDELHLYSKTLVG